MKNKYKTAKHQSKAVRRESDEREAKQEIRSWNQKPTMADYIKG